MKIKLNLFVSIAFAALTILGCSSKTIESDKQEDDKKVDGKILSYSMTEISKFIFIDRFVLYIYGEKVLGYYGWAAQGQDEFYLEGKLIGNEINGIKYSLYDSSSTKFNIKLNSNSVSGMSILDREVLVDTLDIFGKQDEYETKFNIYEFPNMKSKIILSNSTLAKKGFELIEIGKMEKGNDDLQKYDIWYKIKNNEVEGWVYGLIDVLNNLQDE
jgi:hypothetical protein